MFEVVEKKSYQHIKGSRLEKLSHLKILNIII